MSNVVRILKRAFHTVELISNARLRQNDDALRPALPSAKVCILSEDVLWTRFKRPFELEAHDPSG